MQSSRRVISQLPRFVGRRDFSLRADSYDLSGIPGALSNGTVCGSSINYAALGTSALSNDPAVVRRNVMNLYRRMVRNMPGLIQTYEIHQISSREAIDCIRKSMWEPYLGVTNAFLADRLRYQGDVVLNEALNLFFTKAHVAKFMFKPELTHLHDAPPRALDNNTVATKDQSSFLSDFLS
mmetsp:Transcript_9625/g.14022  ORF Transcript_9625/g.14022 Transcript_9625/m.14022 type:complete len:180 (-) Transcript_9625:104-643(-)